MTELDLNTAISPTPLADFLGTGGAASRTLVPYLGALTPQRFDGAEAETEALLSKAAVHDLGWLRRFAVRGEDRFRWLSGMVTNAVETLASGSGAYNLVLNAQGRIQGDCYVWRGEGGELEMEVTAAQADALLAHFDRFIVMDDVEPVPLDDATALGLSGPESPSILTQLGLNPNLEPLTEAIGAAGSIPVRLRRSYGVAVPHYELWTETAHIPALWQALIAAGARSVGAEGLETLRVVEGIPTYGIDIQSRDLVQETSQMRAISFSKGCYLGQEIVERIRSRGQVHRHLRSLELFRADAAAALPTPGTELRAAGSAANPTTDQKPAGTLTSVARLHRNGQERILALGMIRAEAETGGDLTYAEGAARILPTSPKL